MALPLADGEITLAVDGNMGSSFIDLEDVTRVITKGGRVQDIGKGLSDFNGFDTGIFVCTPAIFRALEYCMEEYDDTTISRAVQIMAVDGRRTNAFDIGDRLWIDIDNEKTLIKAESKLLPVLTKASDGPVSRYLNRPISLRITRYIWLKTDLTPNSISIFSFLLSLSAAFFFFLGEYFNLVIGAILTHVSSIIDGCDGEVARLKYKSTSFGSWFDAVLDRYADGFILFGLAYHTLFANDSHLPVFVVGFFALIGTFMNSYMADKYDGFMRKKLGTGRRYFRIGRDVRMFIIFLGALANQSLLTLLFIAVIMNLENIRRVVVLYRNG